MPATPSRTLRLEPLRPDHAELLFAGLSDERIYEYIDDAPPVSVAALRARYERLARGHSPDGSETWLNWAIFDEGEGTYVGYVQATVSSNCRAEIAYVVFPASWCRGHARAAVSTMLELLHTNHGVKCVSASVDTRNLGSRALLESLGFQHLESRRSTIRGALTTDASYFFELP